MLTLTKHATRTTFTLLLAATLVVGLSACAESQTSGSSVDSAQTSMDTASTMPDTSSSMGTDSVSLQSTNQALQGGLTSLGVQQGVQNIEGWEQKLGNVDIQNQQAQQAVSNITDALGQMKSALQANGGPDMQQLTQSVDQTNQGLQSLAQNAQSLNLQQQQVRQLQNLQQTFQQASDQLGGM